MGFSKLVINDYRVKDYRIQRVFNTHSQVRPSKVDTPRSIPNPVDEEILSPVKLNKNFDSLPDLSPSQDDKISEFKSERSE